MHRRAYYILKQLGLVNSEEQFSSLAASPHFQDAIASCVPRADHVVRAIENAASQWNPKLADMEGVATTARSSWPTPEYIRAFWFNWTELTNGKIKYLLQSMDRLTVIADTTTVALDDPNPISPDVVRKALEGSRR